MEYKNIPWVVGVLLSAGRTVTELESVGVQDGYALLEVVTIDRYNKYLIEDFFNKKA